MATRQKTNGAISKGPIGQYAQGLTWQPAQTVAGEPVTNPLNMTADQAYSPYGAGVLTSLAGNEAVKGVEAVPGLIKEGVTAVGDALDTAKAQPGGLQAGFAKVAPEIPGRTKFTRMGGVKAGNAGPPGYLKEVPVKEPATPPNTTTTLPPLEKGGTLPPENEAITQPQYAESATQNRQAYLEQNKATPTQSDITENQKRNLPLDDHDIKTMSDQKRINNTLNRYGIKGPLTQQKEMQESTITTLSNNAQRQIAQDVAGNPDAQTAATDLVNETYANMVNNPGKHQIPQPQLKSEINKYLSNVYARATGNVDVTNKSMIPSTLPDTITYKMKQIMGKDAQSTFAQPDPTKWTPGQQISRYGRDSFDDIIDAKHPEVAGINSDTADLMKADGALKKGVNAEGTQTAKEANTPPPPAAPKWYSPQGLLKIGGATAGIGLGLKEAGVNPTQLASQGLALGATGLQDIHNFITGNSKKDNESDINGQINKSEYNVQPSSIHNTGTIPQTMGSVNTQEQLPNPASITDASGNPLGIDPQSYKTKKAQIDAQVKNYQQLGVPVPQSVLQQQEALANSDPSNPNSLYSIYNQDSKAYGAAANIQTLLNTTAPDYFNQFKSFNDAMQNNDPQYAQLRTALNILNTYNPQATAGLFTAGNKDVAEKELQQAMQGIGWDYYQNINAYANIGGSTPSPTSQQTTGLPQTPSLPHQAAPPAGGISGGLPNYSYNGSQWVQ